MDNHVGSGRPPQRRGPVNSGVRLSSCGDRWRMHSGAAGSPRAKAGDPTISPFCLNMVAGCWPLTGQEVVMARHPEVFVREVVHGRGAAAATHHPYGQGPDQAASGNRGADVRPGQAVSDIVELLQADDGYVRDVIHAFNERGVRRAGPRMERGLATGHGKDDPAESRRPGQDRPPPSGCRSLAGAWRNSPLTSPARRSPRPAGKGSGGSCAPRTSPSRPPPRGNRRPTRTS
jgi:hypothetical protein